MPQYKEQWIININRKEFVISGEEKTKLEFAMKNGDRWFKTGKGNILSVSHIECVTLHSKEIANQLPEGKRSNIGEYLTREEIHERIQNLKNKT